MSVRIKRLAALGVAALAVTGALTGCSQSASGGSDGKIVVVGAENEYSDVAAQIGGKYVSAKAIMSNPNTDPHTFEASASVAKELSSAQILVQNGLGYDDFMTKLAKASPNSSRKVIVAQDVLGLPDSTRNPHLWYDPKTMPAVAKRIAADLGALQPSHKQYFQDNLTTFNRSLETWTNQLASFKQTHANAPVAVTEPVADYALQAAGVDVETPWSLQAAIMNDTDPSPQNSAAQDALFTGKHVKAFLYNQQVTDSITSHYLSLAHDNGIPVVGVYETMPTGYHYQKWMEAELTALQKALTNGTSTEKL
ncbi:zinc ABC transporter substrate-binding protein [Curtobacterium sp. MCBD17_040]|uniref:metal ABC transporter solute-binding protein, Zn/Mn family n=1 Tax=Curtobacterium sp. MCBD17_040 TaxID=2175674 RepID=UPI001C64FC1A|nr:zinc ABC transporter substrate-binding protein [Curtobacterium sp. MCBD17_040]WIB63394.1 zinc ABC transporter substrate-binding protein [Curtobacterium sp. MCBD17_040]